MNPRVKFHVTETVKRLNVEHRTSNIEHRMMITLRFSDLKFNETYSLQEAIGQ